MMREREPIDKHTREEVFHKFGGFCAYCGVQLNRKGFHVDHVVPVASGGVDDILNLFPSCKHCNMVKTNYSLEGFKEFLEGRTLKSIFIVAERFNMIKIHGPVKIQFEFERQGYEFPSELVMEMVRRENVLMEYMGVDE